MSTHRLPSASRHQLALTCVGSVVLPQVDTAWQSGEGGNARHAALAEYVETQQLPEAGAVREWLLGLDADVLEPLRGTQDEVALAWCHETDTGRVLGRRIGRAYSGARLTEYVGTADYIRVTPDLVTVVDLKTGMADVPHPSRNAQLRTLALAACRAHGVSAARVGILHAPEGRTPWWQWADVDAFELEVVAEERRELARRISASTYPRLTLGEHCAHCPARHACPARTAMARALASETAAEDWKRGLDDDRVAAATLARWQAARKALDEVGKALYARAADRPIPLDSGEVWGPRTTTREVIDAEKAWPVLESLLGPDGLRAALTVETSKAGIERGVKAAKASGRVTGAIKAGVAQALDAVRAAGAVETRERVEFEVHRPSLPEGKAA